MFARRLLRSNVFSAQVTILSLSLSLSREKGGIFLGYSGPNRSHGQLEPSSLRLSWEGDGIFYRNLGVRRFRKVGGDSVWVELDNYAFSLKSSSGRVPFLLVYYSWLTT